LKSEIIRIIPLVGFLIVLIWFPKGVPLSACMLAGWYYARYEGLRKKHVYFQKEISAQIIEIHHLKEAIYELSELKDTRARRTFDMDK